ncbi:hypothetical protein D9M69_712870 [compost metagenome]
MCWPTTCARTAIFPIAITLQLRATQSDHMDVLEAGKVQDAGQRLLRKPRLGREGQLSDVHDGPDAVLI